MPKSTRAKFRARFLTKMNDKKRKDPIYITATCKAREKGMVGEERLKRMVESQSLADALGVLRESAFGSGETVEGNASGYDYESLIKREQKKFVEFVKEYAPDDGCEQFFLLPYDFYNAEIAVKCDALGLDESKYASTEGEFTLEQIIALVKGERAVRGVDFPKELAEAVAEASGKLKRGALDGAGVNSLFTRKKYECLLRVCGKDYLRAILKKQINATDISVCLRSSDRKTAESMLIGKYLSEKGGKTAGKTSDYLTDGQITSLIEKDEAKAAKAFSDSDLKALALSAVNSAKSGEPLSALERETGSFGAKKMLENKYTELNGERPFVLYCFCKRNEIACVRTALTGKANGLDPARIERMLLAM